MDYVSSRYFIDKIDSLRSFFKIKHQAENRPKFKNKLKTHQAHPKLRMAENIILLHGTKSWSRQIVHSEKFIVYN